MIDAHIHLDWYKKEERETILKDLKDKRIAGLIAISSDLASCKKVLSLSQKNKLVFPALGWHPEQSLPDEKELAELEELIRKHHHSIVAIGEVGLPYYLKKRTSNVRYKSIYSYFGEIYQFGKRISFTDCASCCI